MQDLTIEPKTRNERIDELEAKMVSNFPIVSCPLTHRFTKGLYVREVFIPKDTLLTSKIHNSQHQYFVLKGKLSVWLDDGEEVHIEAPFIGITEPNTRRVIYAWEDTIWATAHPNPDDLDENQIEERIIDKHDNQYLPEAIKHMIDQANNAGSKRLDSITNKISEQ